MPVINHYILDSFERVDDELVDGIEKRVGCFQTITKKKEDTMKDVW